MSQEKDVLRHLKQHKTIDPITALKRYEVFRLAARIFNLRKAHDIKTHDVIKGKKTFAVYELL